MEVRRNDFFYHFKIRLHIELEDWINIAHWSFTMIQFMQWWQNNIIWSIWEPIEVAKRLYAVAGTNSAK